MILFLNEGGNTAPQINSLTIIDLLRLPLWAADRPTISLAQPNEAAAINHSSKASCFHYWFAFICLHSFHSLWVGVDLLFGLFLLCGALRRAAAINPQFINKHKSTKSTLFRRCKQLTQRSSNQINSSIKLNYLIWWSWLIFFRGGAQCSSILSLFLQLAH